MKKLVDSLNIGASLSELVKRENQDLMMLAKPVVTNENQEGYLSMDTINPRIMDTFYLKFKYGISHPGDLEEFKDLVKIADKENSRASFKGRYNSGDKCFYIYGARLGNLIVDFYHDEKGVTKQNILGEISDYKHKLPQ